MIKKNITIQTIVNKFIEETDYKLEPVEKGIDACDLLKIDEKTGGLIDYGNINDIINSDEFQEWYKNIGGDNNG